MTRAEAARRYLQASMHAHTTALPGEAREAHERTMTQLEKKHPGAAELALIGANSDFDRNLEAGEKEHQRFLRGGLSENELRARREKIRGTSSSTKRPGSSSRARTGARGAARVGVRGGKAYARAHRTILSSSGAGDAGSIVLQAIGVGLGLSLLYLALSPNGSKAFGTLLAGASKFLRLFVAPVDPLNPGAGHAQAKALERIGPPNAAPAGAVSASPVQRAKLNPRFGPAPGIGTPITPTGVLP